MNPPTDRPVKIAVLGPGSWGTALAVLLARNGAKVSLWGPSEQIRDLIRDGENKHFLPGVALPSNLQPEPDLSAAVASAHEILIVVPSHAFRSVVTQAAPFIDTDCSVSWATKGFDPDAHSLLSEVAAELLPGRSLGVLSGPTFAAEVARGLPTAITVASTDEDHASRLAEYLHSDTFRAYTSADVAGVQVGGATKNVMAIAAGISDGLGFGANARIALMTRGLAEIGRLGALLGGQPETFMGLAGLGDLALTCTDNQSRNRRMGLALAAGKTVDQAKEEIQQEVEGVNTTREVYHLARKLGVEMPITDAVYRVLYEDLDPRQAVRDLLHRQQRREVD